jgi:enoyl-[acyl-carrier protein] reductase I
LVISSVGIKKVRVNTISQSPTATKAGQGGFEGFIAFQKNVTFR